LLVDVPHRSEELPRLFGRHLRSRRIEVHFHSLGQHEVAPDFDGPDALAPDGRRFSGVGQQGADSFERQAGLGPFSDAE